MTPAELDRACVDAIRQMFGMRPLYNHPLTSKVRLAALPSEAVTWDDGEPDMPPQAHEKAKGLGWFDTARRVYKSGVKLTPKGSYKGSQAGLGRLTKRA